MATGTFCPRDPGESDVDIAFSVERGIGHRMQVLGDRHGDFDLMRIARLSIGRDYDRSGRGARGTRATMKSSELMTTAPSISPKRTRGRRKSSGRRPVPVIRTSPPGRAAARIDRLDVRVSVNVFLAQQPVRNSHELQLPRVGLRPNYRGNKPEVQRDLHDGQSVKPGADVIYYDADTLRKVLRADAPAAASRCRTLEKV